MSYGTRDAARAFAVFEYRAITFSGQSFQTVILTTRAHIAVPRPLIQLLELGLGCFPFARHYWGNLV